MFRPLALYIGLRYTRAKRRSCFISFISLVSMIGIALGVMILITVLSVLNGFDYQIKTRFFSVAPQVTVSTSQDIANTWRSLSKKIMKLPGVMGVAPYVAGKGMALHLGSVSGLTVMGILPQEEQKISVLNKKMVTGSLSSLIPGKFHIVLGKELAGQLGVNVGDELMLFTPQTTMTPIGILPRYKRFQVTGIFKVGEGFGFDQSVGYIDFNDAAKLFPAGKNVRGLHIKLTNIYDAPRFTQTLQSHLSFNYLVSDWTQQFGAFFKALAMEKTMMFVILLFIIAVAVFNLVASLVMGVNEKQADIAILRTLGTSRGTIMSIFIIQGAIVGLLGTLIGIVGGIVLSLNATALVNAIQQLFHVQFISSSVYFVNFLPSQLQWSDVLRVGGLAFLLSLLATIYPAWRSFKVQPAEALRYE